ncbi:MAG: putative transporter transrane protein [Ilumatobacteraceae bacterium]|nr:putative transporter transrane protein [Ilumatobacteraceae bacterium]
MSAAADATFADVVAPLIPTADVARLRVTQGRVIRSEWLKMRTLRSSWLTMALAIVSIPGIGIAIAWSTAHDWQRMRVREQAHFNPLADPMSGFNLAQLAVGVLGVLLIAGEYSGGMIRATLGAVPARLPVLWAKLTVFTTLTLATMLPVAVLTFFVSQRLLSAQHIQTTWDTPSVARSVIGVGLYLTVVAALSIGLGAIIRNVAGAIGVFVGVILVLPVIASALPQTWGDRINKWLPSNAGQALMSFGSDNTSLSPWRGFIVFCLYAVVAVVGAATLLRRRDA